MLCRQRPQPHREVEIIPLGLGLRQFRFSSVIVIGPSGVQFGLQSYFVMTTDRIGLQEVLLPVNHKNQYQSLQVFKLVRAGRIDSSWDGFSET
ncbi:hypothetical protein pdam_00017483 [Pocillopora damicornis]|uniref:Uncharacterized protein n=1 Tax=Pocillopora damicornis TaxID=46731 RepID=A0A3M6TV09_POCDA|nr:hypothetical protein pdam_00017483 [Pocillopora damicornis]